MVINSDKPHSFIIHSHLSIGDVSDIGVGKGKKYSVNFPLKTGITDPKYQKIFKSVIGQVVKVYKPSVIVLQCGADSLSDDAIGVFNLTLSVFFFFLPSFLSFFLSFLSLGKTQDFFSFRVTLFVLSL